MRADHLDDLYEQLATSGGRRGEGLAPTTIVEVHMILRAALDLAVQRRSAALPRSPPRRPHTHTHTHTHPSRRCIDLDAATLTELDRWRRRLRVDDLPHGPDDWMFCNPTRRHLNPESVTQLLDRIVRRAGIAHPPARPASHPRLVAHQAGVPVKVVSERLGHATPPFTIDTYQHVLPRMQADAARTFAELLAPALPPSRSSREKTRLKGRAKTAQ